MTDLGVCGPTNRSNYGKAAGCIPDAGNQTTPSGIAQPVSYEAILFGMSLASRSLIVRLLPSMSEIAAFLSWHLLPLASRLAF